VESSVANVPSTPPSPLAPLAGDGLPPREDVYIDEGLGSICSRAGAYLAAGVPIHFRGPAGMGKTTLALHVAQGLGRPVVLVTGDAALTSTDLLGREIGHESRQKRDHYVSRVVKTESSVRASWVDSVLTRAVAEGHVLVYDEFTRSPAEANNALLSALEEGILAFSNPVRPARYVRAHPAFRCILTSNPEEYVGVSAAPDALFDRVITFDLGACPPATEAGIVARRTGLTAEAAATVVGIVRRLRDRGGAANPPSIRTAILIGRVLAALGLDPDPGDARFVQVCLDVLETRAPRGGAGDRRAYLDDMRAAIRAAGAAPGARAA
jgi:nitric oxide reductase NorQ protein